MWCRFPIGSGQTRSWRDLSHGGLYTPISIGKQRHGERPSSLEFNIWCTIRIFFPIGATHWTLQVLDEPNTYSTEYVRGQFATHWCHSNRTEMALSNCQPTQSMSLWVQESFRNNLKSSTVSEPRGEALIVASRLFRTLPAPTGTADLLSALRLLQTVPCVT